jgi:hypothetical protein
MTVDLPVALIEVRMRGYLELDAPHEYREFGRNANINHQGHNALEIYNGKVIVT